MFFNKLTNFCFFCFYIHINIKKEGVYMQIVSTNPMYTVIKGQNGSTIIQYDDPGMWDEECTYTFNKDGSASCVSNAWGTKTELPKDTFVDDGKEVSPEQLVKEFNDYYAYCKKNNIKIMA